MVRFSSFLACIGLVGLFVWYGAASLTPSVVRLNEWRDTAQSAPEGEATRDLFERAVEAGVISWNPATRMIEMASDTEMEPRLRNELFRVKEGGVVIAKELRRLHAINSRIAVRVRIRQCDRPCDQEPDLLIAVDTSMPGSNQVKQALAAAQTRTNGVPQPLPRLHYRLSRAVAGNYGPWKSWQTFAPLTITAVDSDIEALDVIGHLGSVPPGWKLARTWCVGKRGIVENCATGELPTVSRLERLQGRALPVTLFVQPVSSLPRDLGTARYYLSDRVLLDCLKNANCTPRWIASTGTNRYVRRAKESNETTERPELPQMAAVQSWVTTEGNRIVPNDAARETGLISVLGEGYGRPGTVLTALAQMPQNTRSTITLNPSIQTLTHNVLRDMVERRRNSIFAGRSYRFPADIARASIAVIDLRSGNSPGAIRAATGVPSLPEGISPWDAEAMAYDPSSPVASTSPAWTGRGWHHIPGSAWKVFTSLALIDALVQRKLKSVAAGHLQNAILGAPAAQLDLYLGKGLMTARGGICPPRKLRGGAKPAHLRGGKPVCGGRTYSAIRDSGKGGPLRKSHNVPFGLADALTVSSNIWFVAALLKAEAEAKTVDAGQFMEGTAKRLGYFDMQRLDGGMGVSLKPRDPVSMELTAENADVQMLASSAFGQRTQAGPLVLAQLAGSVATGRDIRPSLLEPHQVPAPLFTSPLAAPLLEQVRKGMRQVVSGTRIPAGNRRGTAVGVFKAVAPDLMKRVGGKTGTSQRGIVSGTGRSTARDRISSFMGWLDDSKGRPAFAIGCSITVLGQKRSGGGLRVPQLCALASAAVFKRLENEVLSK